MFLIHFQWLQNKLQKFQRKKKIVSRFDSGAQSFVYEREDDGGIDVHKIALSAPPNVPVFLIQKEINYLNSSWDFLWEKYYKQRNKLMEPNKYLQEFPIPCPPKDHKNWAVCMVSYVWFFKHIDSNEHIRKCKGPNVQEEFRAMDKIFEELNSKLDMDLEKKRKFYQENSQIFIDTRSSYDNENSQEPFSHEYNDEGILESENYSSKYEWNNEDDEKSQIKELEIWKRTMSNIKWEMFDSEESSMIEHNNWEDHYSGDDESNEEDKVNYRKSNHIFEKENANMDQIPENEEDEEEGSQENNKSGEIIIKKEYEAFSSNAKSCGFKICLNIDSNMISKSSQI